MSTKKELIEKLIGEARLRFESKDLASGDIVEVRRKILEKLTKTSLTSISKPVFDVGEASTKNCENMIGKIETPLGIAGPLKVNGDYAQGVFYIPLATTEGALVASVNRGCKAISVSGGADVFIEQFGITRAPLFVTSGLKESRKFVAWVKSHFKEIAQKAAQSSTHLKLISITPLIAGRNVFLRCVFDSQDAMGMNMVTIACDYIAKELIEKATGVKCLSLSGNACIDKKPSWINKIEGRGYSLHAEATVPKNVVEKILKADPDKIVEIYQRKVMTGSSVSGAIGFNAHHANVVAAVYLATGQDIAHVVEGSLGTTFVEKLENGNLYFSVSVPSLVLGTVGGGTGLATQYEALKVLGVEGGGNPPGANAKKFAEIVAAAILAGEISLLSALASSDLAKSHRKLGRGKCD